MRIAAVQLTIEPARRAATLQRALRAVDAAAETDPAPDLVVLPLLALVPSGESPRSTFAERVAGPTVAAFGLRARQWGLFIALGILEQGPQRPFVTGILLDRDGDVVLIHRQSRFSGPAQDRYDAGDAVSAANWLLGRVAILCGEDLLDAGCWESAKTAKAQWVLGLRGLPGRRTRTAAGDEASRTSVIEHAARLGIGAVVAEAVEPSPASAARAGRSMIVGPDGAVLASADSRETTTLFAELKPLGPPFPAVAGPAGP